MQFSQSISSMYYNQWWEYCLVAAILHFFLKVWTVIEQWVKLYKAIHKESTGFIWYSCGMNGLNMWITIKQYWTMYFKRQMSSCNRDSAMKRLKSQQFKKKVIFDGCIINQMLIKKLFFKILIIIISIMNIL